MQGLEWIGDAQAPRTVWFVHGVLGQGRNWRSFARRALQQPGFSGFRAALPDLRNHGQHPARTAPHTLEAAAADLAAWAEAVGPPDMLVGHSLGGKVVLAWLASGTLPASTPVWVLDAAPGVADLASPGRRAEADPLTVLAALRGAPVPAESREPIRAHLQARGLPAPIIAWLLTSAVRGPEGWQWVYNLDGIDAMLGSYATMDAWPTVEAYGQRVHLVHAGRGGRYSPPEIARAESLAGEGRVHWHTLPDAGHWLHVEDPDGVLALLGAAVR